MATRLNAAGVLFDQAQVNGREWAGVALAIAAALLAPVFWSRRFRKVAEAFHALARNRRAAIVFAALFPLILRLALVPVLPVPRPVVADEFGYLLLADTFASGRITNPPHPMGRYLETIYVFQNPVYTSIYPVAPALVMALALALGLKAWWGVWLAVGLMCGLMVWMLQGWMPPRWALAGGLLVGLRIGVISPWMNTYWGGAVAAAGGALVLGAVPRIWRRPRVRDIALFGLGLAVLAQSRPFEGALMSLPLVLALGWKRQHIRRIALPLTILLLLLVAVTGLYNFAVTGSPWLPPYGLHQKVYGTPQPLYFQKPILDAPGIHHYADIQDVFRWQLGAHQLHFSWEGEWARLESFWNFFVQPLLTIPLVVLALRCRSRKMLVPVAALSLMLIGNSQYPFFFPHYAAPVCGIVLLLIVQGVRYLALWRGRGAVGVACAGLVLVLAGFSSILTAAGAILRPWNVTAGSTARSDVLDVLNKLGGKHLVLVHYGPNHSFHYGVIYNSANIDASAVVWARQVDDAGDRSLIDYFHDRDVWLFHPDEPVPSLTAYPGKPQLHAVFHATGRRDDIEQGVTPGGLAVILGDNFEVGIGGLNGQGLLNRLPLRIAQTNAELGDLLVRTKSEGSATASPPGCPDCAVTFDGRPARVITATRGYPQDSITVEVPPGLPSGWSTVIVRSGKLRSTGRRVRVLAKAPGVFQVKMSDGKPRAVVLHEDRSLVDLEHPAHPGERLLALATGLGPLSGAETPLVIGVDNRGVPLLGAAPAPSMPGVQEVEFQVPEDLSGNTDIAFSIGVRGSDQTIYSNATLLPVE